MPKSVSGYMTGDGVFYPTEAEADRHEHANHIREMCVGYKNLDPERFMALILKMSMPIRNFINANEKCIQASGSQEDTSTTHSDQADNLNRDDDNEALEQFEASGRDDVSDMGNSTRIESVPERSKVNGTRGRRGNA